MKPTVLCVVALWAAACSSKKPDGGGAAATPVATSDGGTADGGAIVAAPIDAGTPPSPPGPQVAIRKEVEAFLTAWVDLQNKGDFAAYAKLYDRKHFRGVKRTHDGKARNYDGPGWVRDRKRMFDKGFTVAAELESVETWHDAGTKLKDGVASLRFLQRWKGGGYADHGLKVMQLWRDRRGGWRIVYEDLINSEPGWDRTVDAAPPLALTAPKSDAEALALWKQVAPTGANYEDRLAAIPEDPAVRRPMAMALLREGNFACKETIDTGYCGEEILEWAPLEPKAGLKDPCLRRRLALWALDELEDADVAGLAPVLTTLVALPKPEDDLPLAALTALPDNADDLRLDLMKAAKAAEREELAQEQVAELKADAALVRAATELHLDKAVEKLDTKRHRAVLLAAMNDDALDDDTRSAVLERFASDHGKDVKQALVTLTDDVDCKLAMQAAEALADLGDTSHLPQRPSSQNPGDYMNAICMIVHGSDERMAHWHDFLAPKVIERTITHNEFGDGEDEGEGVFAGEDDAEDEPEPEVDPDAPSGEITTKSSGPGTTTNRWDTVKADDVALDSFLGAAESTCTGLSCKVGNLDIDERTVVFGKTKDGLRIIEIITHSWNGCGC